MKTKLHGARERLRRKQGSLKTYIDRLRNSPREGSFWRSPEFRPYCLEMIAKLKEEIIVIENQISTLQQLEQLKKEGDTSNLEAKEGRG